MRRFFRLLQWIVDVPVRTARKATRRVQGSDWPSLYYNVLEDAMDPTLLGQIIATVITAAADAGAIALNPQGVITSPEAVANIVKGFLDIWLQHPASGKVPNLRMGG